MWQEEKLENCTLIFYIYLWLLIAYVITNFWAAFTIIKLFIDNKTWQNTWGKKQLNFRDYKISERTKISLNQTKLFYLTF